MVQAASHFASIIREVSIDHLAANAQQAPRFLILGAPADSQALAEQLLGPEFHYFASITDATPQDAVSAFDAIVIIWSGADQARLQAQVAVARQHGWPVLIVVAGAAAALPDLRGVRATGWPADPAVSVHDARTALVQVIDEERWPAVGRYLPALRQATARELVLTTARVNAEFSGLSAVTGFVPVFGTILAVGGDFLVLTKNQVLMLFKLAALHGRDLDDRTKLYLEMASVVGVAFGWRTVARGLIGAIPGPVGIVPRVGIAYGGTVAVGMAAHAYYHEGRLPTVAEIESHVQRAIKWLKERRAGAKLEPPAAAGAIGAGEGTTSAATTSVTS